MGKRLLVRGDIWSSKVINTLSDILSSDGLSINLGAILNLTEGAIPFGSSTGSFSIDADNLFWDDTNNRQGIGTNSPSQHLHVKGDGSANSIALFAQDKADSFCSVTIQQTSFPSTSNIGSLEFQIQALDADLENSTTRTATSIQSSYSDQNDATLTTKLDIQGFNSGTSASRIILQGANLGLNGQSTFGTSADGVIAIAAGTAPADSPADAVQCWVEDQSGAGTANLKFRTEDGTTFFIGSGGDFSNGGEAGGADRTLGNTDLFDLGFITNNLVRIHIQSDGLIGFGGLTAPQNQLHGFLNDTSTTPILNLEQDGTGDAALSFELTGLQEITMGLDNDDGDLFKISDSTALGTNDRFTLDGSGNIGLNGVTAWGTSAAGVLAIGNGTAPSTSPANLVQIWSADRGGVAADAAIHWRVEDGGFVGVIGEHTGFGTATPDGLMELEVSGTDTIGDVYITVYNDQTSFNPFLAFRKSHNDTADTLTATIDNEILGQFLAYGVDSGNTAFQQAGSIVWRQNGAAGSATPPTDMEFYTSPGGASAMTQRMVIDPSGNLGIGPNAMPFPSGGGTPVLAMTVASGNPTGIGANTAGIFVKDVAASGELHAFDEAGNVTLLSPHDPETGEWIFHSHNTVTGKTYRVNMERLVSVVEEISGKQLAELIYE